MALLGIDKIVEVADYTEYLDAYAEAYYKILYEIYSMSYLVLYVSYNTTLSLRSSKKRRQYLLYISKVTSFLVLVPQARIYCSSKVYPQNLKYFDRYIVMDVSSYTCSISFMKKVLHEILLPRG